VKPAPCTPRPDVEAVLKLTERGWRLFPVEGNGKRKSPLIADWPNLASNQEEQIRSWARRWPSCNWAVATGNGSGVFVMDFDGEDGLAVLRRWKVHHGEGWADTLTAKTSRGLHSYFHWPGSETYIRNSAGKIAHGVDVRGDGGYAIVPPSIHESGHVYAWDDKGEDVSIAEAPTWLVEFAMEASNNKFRSEPQAAYSSTNIPEGQRNATLTSLAGMLRRRGMTVEAIEAALLAENRARCHPALPEKEVRTIAASVARYAPQALEKPALKIDAPKWPEPLAPEAFHGLAGEFVGMVSPHSEADPAGLLVEFLVMFGSLVGKGPHFRVEETQHGTNLFAVLVGNTSDGRKGSAHDNAMALFEDVDAVWARCCIKSGCASGEGIIYHVRDARGDDPGIKEKRLHIHESEFASPLRVMQRDGNTLSPILRQAWDARCLQNLTKNNPDVAIGAHISMTAHITPQEVRSALDRIELANGFGNRILWACVRRSKLLPEGARVPTERRRALVEKVAAALKFSKQTGEVHRDELARRVWAEVYADLTTSAPGLFGAVISRGAAQVARLSLIYALLDSSAIVKADHLKAALAVWTYAEDSARFVFGDAFGNALADRLLAALRANNTGITKAEIHSLLGRNYKAASIDSALRLLADNGLAHAETKKTKGRDVELWSAIRRGN
jgi:hypothetical protein